MDDTRAAASVLYLYPFQIGDDLERVQSGASPTEKLYGLLELQQRRWRVKFSDTRFLGPWARVLSFFRRHGFSLIDPGTIRELGRATVVVVKDDFSLMVSVVCRLSGTHLVYVDSMFGLPRRWWQRWSTSLSIRLSDQVVSYSTSQVARWVEELGVPKGKFTVLPYTMDMAFYGRNMPTARPTGDGYLLAVGRDLGRDYRTLIEATRAAGLKLKLVTLPYLLKGLDIEQPDIEVFQHLTYQELFALYRGATAVVVPVAKGIDYPSGIRAMLEAMILGIPVVVTRTPTLVEYVGAGEEVTFVEPGDAGELEAALLEVVRDGVARRDRAERAREGVMSRYGMDRFVDGLEVTLRRVLSPSPPSAGK